MLIEEDRKRLFTNDFGFPDAKVHTMPKNQATRPPKPPILMDLLLLLLEQLEAYSTTPRQNTPRSTSLVSGPSVIVVHLSIVTLKACSSFLERLRIELLRWVGLMYS